MESFDTIAQPADHHSSSGGGSERESMVALFAEMTRAIRNTRAGHMRFFDPAGFEWVAGIESRWTVIRTEFERLSRAIALLPGIEELSPIQSGVTSDRRWKVFPLFVYGHRLERNERRCPATTELIRQIPGLRSAMFSILQPGKEIPEHAGLYCGLLRFHLGLKVPNPNTAAGICVAGTAAHWTEGRSLIFDDSHPHSAWNRSGEDRVILLADFPRPLEPALQAANERVLDAIGRSKLTEATGELWAAWESKHGEELDTRVSAY